MTLAVLSREGHNNFVLEAIADVKAGALLPMLTMPSQTSHKQKVFNVEKGHKWRDSCINI